MQPTFETARLKLRPFQLSDAADVQRLAGHSLIAATTANIPHPYPDGAAEKWISMHPEWFNQGIGIACAVVVKASEELVGCVSFFGVSKDHQKAELGYWIAVDHWNKGFCTEACRPLIDYGFREMNLHRIFARHQGNNPSSGKVMEKLGMRKEGVLKQDFKKNGVFHDIVIYGLLRP